MAINYKSYTLYTHKIFIPKIYILSKINPTYVQKLPAFFLVVKWLTFSLSKNDKSDSYDSSL